MSEPLHVTDAEFEKTVLESDLPVVVDFWAPVVRTMPHGRADPR